MRKAFHAEKHTKIGRALTRLGALAALLFGIALPAAAQLGGAPASPSPPAGSFGTLSPSPGGLNPNLGTLGPGTGSLSPRFGALGPAGSSPGAPGALTTPPTLSPLAPRTDTGSLGGGGLSLTPTPLTPRPSLPGSPFGTPSFGSEPGRLTTPTPGTSVGPTGQFTAPTEGLGALNPATPRPSVPGSVFGTGAVPGAPAGVTPPGSTLGSGAGVGR
jgi:hypothetical protein